VPAKGTGVEKPTGNGEARESLQAARAGVRRVRQLLSQPSPEVADQCAALMRDVEVQLGCVAAILQTSGAKPDAEIRVEVEELQAEVAIVAKFLADADRLLTGWLGTIRTRRSGYTDRGQAAPLVLVKQVTLEG